VNFQRVFALVKKDLKKTLREPAVLFMIFLFPVVFVLAFGASFGGIGGGQSVTYQIGVVNMTQTGSSQQWSQVFINALSSTTILNVQVYTDNQIAQGDLTQGKIQAVMIIPSVFSESVASYQMAPNDPSRWINTTVPLYLDKGSIIATQAIPPIIQQALAAVFNQNQNISLNPVQLETGSLVEVKKLTAFDFMVPGMFAFASIFLIMMVAGSFTEDRENGMMKRIRITPTSPTEFMTSQVLSNMTTALVQAILVFLMAYLMGFRPNIDTPIYLSAFGLVLVFSLSNVGFGLITAAIAKTPGAATGISFIFLLPQLFLGTFVGASLSGSAQIAGRFVPSYYVTDALTSLLLRGAAITSPLVVLDLAMASLFSIAVLVIGIILYARYYRI
jgi:ABC-type multidrug transport system permease subunit